MQCSTFNLLFLLKVFVHSNLPKFLNLKHLELKDSFKSPWILVTQILESSPELEHLCFEEVIELFLSFGVSYYSMFPKLLFHT